MAKTIAVLIIGIISISFGSIFVKFCTDVPAIMISTYRMVVASAILLIICKFKKVRIIPANSKLLWYGLLGGFFLAMHFVTWINSLKLTTVASSVVLVDTNPIFVGILSYLILKQKQSIELIAGIILSIIGSIILTAADSNLFTLVTVNKQALLGDMLALAGALMGSCYLVIGSKMREHLEILNYITLVYTAAAIFLLIISLGMRLPFGGYKSTSYLFMVLLAIIPQLFGHTAFNWALKHLKTSMVAITILGEPISATILAYFLFHEHVHRFQFLGIILIFFAIIIASRKAKK